MISEKASAAEVARSLVLETFCEPKTDDAPNLDSNTLIDHSKDG